MSVVCFFLFNILTQIKNPIKKNNNKNPPVLEKYLKKTNLHRKLLTFFQQAQHSHLILLPGFEKKISINY